MRVREEKRYKESEKREEIQKGVGEVEEYKREWGEQRNTKGSGESGGHTKESGEEREYKREWGREGIQKRVRKSRNT